MVEKTFAPKEIIYREGDTPDVAYIIIGGKVDLMKAQGREDVTVASAETGQGFGEEALLESHNVRAFTARAIQPTKVQTLSYDEFEKALSQSPPVIQGVLYALARHAQPKAGSGAPAKEEPKVPAVSVGDITEITVAPAKDAPDKLFTPEKFALSRLPLRVGGFAPQAGQEPSTQNHINIPCEGPPLKVSKQQFEVVIENESLIVIDQGSRFCTIVNGQPIGRGYGNYSAPLQKGVNQLILGGKKSPYKIVVECK